ncbi:putative glycoside hydrolase [Nocardioides lijunqiniae]|uniref:putative glycoside hydrolase n=1 Tax=Nocardioides lijunqiniae TaxID=2760832 RepID=UPI0018775138|nr:putative glycoside hydrolase [Nocardioides lijunqiniae]
MQHRLGTLGITLGTMLLTVGTLSGGAQATVRTVDAPRVTATGAQDLRTALRGPAARPRPARAPARSGSGIVALDWSDLDDTPRPARGDYLVMQPWEYARIPALKAANPRLRVLMYKDAAATVVEAHETGLYPTGVGYREASTHPRWFLTDRAGRRLEWSDWRGLYPMNVADAGYQRAWGDNVLAELRAHDWDGVSIDDTLTYLSHPTVDDRVSTQIPDDATMYRATESFLATIGPRLRGAGYLAVPNVTVEWDTWRSTLTDWSRYVSGWENEYFVKWGLDRETRFHDADWEWKMRMAAWCAARRLPLLAITYSSRSDRATMRYHRATWLLTWNGRTGASIFVPAEEGASHWSPRANTRLGAPRGKPRERDGVWRRAYARGLVLVNPTTHARRVTVPRGYRTRSGTVVRSVRLGPRTARLLRR